MGKRGRRKSSARFRPSDSPIQKLRAKLGYSFADMHCRTLDDMTRAEIRAIEKEYGAKVVRV